MHRVHHACQCNFVAQAGAEKARQCSGVKVEMHLVGHAGCWCSNRSWLADAGGCQQAFAACGSCSHFSSCHECIGSVDPSPTIQRTSCCNPVMLLPSPGMHTSGCLQRLKVLCPLSEPATIFSCCHCLALAHHHPPNPPISCINPVMLLSALGLISTPAAAEGVAPAV